MDLKQLDVKAIERLLNAAAREQQRRRGRRPAQDVRLLLHAMAADAGYSLADVFPELDLPAVQPGVLRSVPLAVAVATGAPAESQDLPAPPPPPPPRPASAPVSDAEIVARDIIRALASKPHSEVVAVNIDAVQAMVGLNHDWPLFHAGMEEASRRNWIHFRGNSQCVLTGDGTAAAAVPHLDGTRGT